MRFRLELSKKCYTTYWNRLRWAGLSIVRFKFIYRAHKKHMEKIKAGLNIAVFVLLAGFIGLEVWTLISHFLKT